jgi:hypothetical protein
MLNKGEGKFLELNLNHYSSILVSLKPRDLTNSSNFSSLANIGYPLGIKGYKYRVRGET